MNMIIGKRQIILSTLILGLGIAIYLNWEFSKSESSHEFIKKVDSIKNYGEAQFVRSKSPKDVATISTKSDEYFSQSRLNRQKSRDEAIETLKEMLDNKSLDAQQKEQLSKDASILAKSIESEGKIENIIKAKGFSEVMAYIQGDKTTIIVKTKGLVKSEVAQIKDIVIKETGFDAENISIVEVK